MSGAASISHAMPSAGGDGSGRVHTLSQPTRCAFRFSLDTELFLTFNSIHVGAGQARPRLESALVSKVQPNEDKLAFKLNPVSALAPPHPHHVAMPFAMTRVEIREKIETAHVYRGGGGSGSFLAADYQMTDVPEFPLPRMISLELEASQKVSEPIEPATHALGTRLSFAPPESTEGTVGAHTPCALLMGVKMSNASSVKCHKLYRQRR